jgi:hypothetical protein
LDGEREAAYVTVGARVPREHTEAIVVTAGFKFGEVEPDLEPEHVAIKLGREDAGKTLFEFETEYAAPGAGEGARVHGAA